jgi:hypothetical protein
MSNVTNISGQGKIQQERTATVAIIPGMLLERVGATGIRPHSTKGAIDEMLFAENSVDMQTMRDGEYAIGDTVFFHQYGSGDMVNGILKLGENVAASAKLASAGDGYLEAVDVAVAATLATGVVASNNAITFTALGTDEPSVTLIDPGANDQELVVSVEGLLVKVSLATDGSGVITSTATEVIDAVNDDDAANILVSAADTGASTGAAVVAAVATTALSGAVAADNYIALAYQAVDATSAALDCAVRIK